MINVDFDGIDALEERLSVTLRYVMIDKILLDTKVKIQNMILSIDRGDMDQLRGKWLSLMRPSNRKSTRLHTMYEKVLTNITRVKILQYFTKKVHQNVGTVEYDE